MQAAEFSPFVARARRHEKLHRITGLILEQELIKPREGDEEVRKTGETKVENDLAWARENPKQKQELKMPQRGVWQITEKGRERLFRVAKAVHNKNPDEAFFVRCSQKCLVLLADLGKRLH